MDTKETLEVVECLKVLGDCVREAKKDGVVNLWDAPKFAPTVTAAVRAVNGAEKVAAELKDLDAAETQVLVDKLFAALTNLADAVIGKQVVEV